ncbi:MAG: hypothetical protein OHK0038_05500 [Flammeovirgaceae bacterium]
MRAKFTPLSDSQWQCIEKIVKKRRKSVHFFAWYCISRYCEDNKKINGRKRTILVDKLGLPFAIKVTEANLLDNEAGIQAIERLSGKVPRLQKIAVDSGNKDKFVFEKNRW